MKRKVSFLLSVPCKFDPCTFCLGVMWRISLSLPSSPFSVSISFSLSWGNKLFFLFTMSHLSKKYQFPWRLEKKRVGISLLWHTHFQVCSPICWCFRSCQHCCDKTHTTVQKIVNTILVAKTVFHLMLLLHLIGFGQFDRHVRVTLAPAQVLPAQYSLDISIIISIIIFIIIIEQDGELLFLAAWVRLILAENLTYLGA